MAENNSISVNIRNEVYKGGQSLISLIEDVAFAVKYPIIEGKLNNNEKAVLKELLNEIVSNLDKSSEQIINEYLIDDLD